MSEAGILQDFPKFRGYWPTINSGNSSCLTGPNPLAEYTAKLTASAEYHQRPNLHMNLCQEMSLNSGNFAIIQRRWHGGQLLIRL